MEFPKGARGEGAFSPVLSSPAEMFLSGTSGRITKVDLIDGFIIYSLTHSFIHRAPPLFQTGTLNMDKTYSMASRDAHSLKEKLHMT